MKNYRVLIFILFVIISCSMSSCSKKKIDEKSKKNVSTKVSVSPEITPVVSVLVITPAPSNKNKSVEPMVSIGASVPIKSSPTPTVKPKNTELMSIAKDPRIIEGFPIQGDSNVSELYLAHFVQSVNTSFNPQIAKAFIEISKKYRIRGDIAFCQSIHETNYFRYTGDVRIEQNNYAGIGATGGGVPGDTFKTIEDGVRAQLQHLYAYATYSSLPAGEKIVDPRFWRVRRASIRYWKDLGGAWAVPGYDRNVYPNLKAAHDAKDSYGHIILKLYLKIITKYNLTS